MKYLGILLLFLPIFADKAYEPVMLNNTNSAIAIYFLKIIFLIGAIAIVLFVWKKYFSRQGVQGSTNIKVIERLQLDLKTTIFLLEVNGKYLLLASSDKNVKLLDSFGEKDPKIDLIEKKDFDSVLAQFLKKGKK